MKVNRKTSGTLYRHLVKYPAPLEGDTFIHEMAPNPDDLNDKSFKPLRLESRWASNI